jgi:hypothetical protein
MIGSLFTLVVFQAIQEFEALKICRIKVASKRTVGGGEEMTANSYSIECYTCRLTGALVPIELSIRRSMTHWCNLGPTSRE